MSPTDSDDAQVERPQSRVEFVGGPYDGDVMHGLLARLLLMHEPPFFCADVEGRWEHYERQDATTFRHLAHCHSMTDHPPCGHDHTTDW